MRRNKDMPVQPRRHGLMTTYDGVRLPNVFRGPQAREARKRRSLILAFAALCAVLGAAAAWWWFFLR